MQPYHRQSLSLDASGNPTRPMPPDFTPYFLDGNSGFNSRLFSTSQLTRDNHPSEFQGRSFSHQPSPRRVRQEKSFLDDDWLLDRVENDSNMAMVAAGLVRPRSAVHFDERSRTPNSSTSMFPPFHQSYQDPTACREDDFYAPLKQPALSNPPPRDYICKLCNVPGHWLKDCELFEPRNGASVKGFGLTGHKNNVMPPGNYICRLCGISGHWIEQCTQFQPKTDNKGHQKDNRDRLNCFKSIPPPPGYVCNLCHQPGHWLQQCTKFEPMPMHRRKEHFFNR